jgi:hypothetical protein
MDLGTGTTLTDDRGTQMADHERRMPNFRVTLTEELRDAVDYKAAELARPGEPLNRSLAFREILREWIAAHPVLSKGIPKPKKRPGGAK